MRNRGFNYRQAMRVVRPEVAAKFDARAPSGRGAAIPTDAVSVDRRRNLSSKFRELEIGGVHTGPSAIGAQSPLLIAPGDDEQRDAETAAGSSNSREPSPPSQRPRTDIGQ